MSEPLERIIRVGEAEYRKRFRTGIWVPITTTALFALVSVGGFFYSASTMDAITYTVLATLAVLCLWISRVYYALWKAEAAKLNLVLLLLVGADPENTEDDEPDC